MSIAPTVSHIAAKLFSAKTAHDIETIIGSIPDANWRPLGDRANNYAPVNVGADAADGWAEKVINGIDAILEDEVELAGDYELDSPRAAAEKYLDVPGGHVWNLDDDKRRPLAARLVVTMRSGTDKDPTIVVDDAGIGQHPDSFHKTLVSLNESNKRDKLYLMGAYGWGGASSYAFSAYTLYISRRDPRLLSPGQQDEVGWTIVRYNPLDQERFSKTGVYEYLVLPGDPGAIRRFDPSALPADRTNWHGTIATLIDYRLGRYSTAAAWEPKESLWVIGNAVLFDPVMPFLLRDERPKSVAASEANSLRGMVIHGTGTRLLDLQRRARRRAKEDTDDGGIPRDERVTYSNTFHGRLSTGGAVTIRYWVLGETGKYRRDWAPTRSYVMPEQAVTITHNGQRHMSYPRAVFERLGFMTLSRSMLVQVETDGLDWPEKRELFSTTRDRLKESAVTDELRNQLDAALRQDEALRDEERRRKERALGRRSKEQADRIRARLAKAIEALRKGMVQKYRTIMSNNPELPLFTDQLLVDPPERNGSDPADAHDDSAEPITYEGDPTFIKVLNGPIRVPAGGRAVIRVAIDAADDYFATNPGRFLPIVSKGNEAFGIIGFSDVRGGRMRCTITAGSASAGDRGRIIFTVLPPEAGLPLVDEADLEATEPPQKRVKAAESGLGKIKGGPEPQPIYRDDWATFGFDEDTIAKIEGNAHDPNLITIYVNMDYPAVVAALMGRRNTTEENLENFKEGYCATMALLAWLQNQEERKEDINQAEMRRAAQAWIFTALSE